MTLRVSSGEIPLGVTEQDFDRLKDLLFAKDNAGILAMALNEQMFFVPSGTKAKVIGRNFEAREVRIMSGPLIGRSGWVSTALIAD